MGSQKNASNVFPIQNTGILPRILLQSNVETEHSLFSKHLFSLWDKMCLTFIQLEWLGLQIS